MNNQHGNNDFDSKTFAEFLHFVFDGKCAEDWAPIWVRQRSVSIWIQDLADIDVLAAEFSKLAPPLDVFYGIGLSAADLGFHHRGLEQDLAGIVALFIDVDFAHDVHKKPNLPPTEKDALALLREYQLAPSIIIHTGHGLQALWLLEEAWMFDKPGELERAKDLSTKWQAIAHAKAAEHGWTIDSTADLSRLGRIPGSINHKDNPPLPVKILEVKDGVNTYFVADFVAHLPQGITSGSETGRNTGTEGTTSATFELNPDADPPRKKFLSLMAREPRFAESWNGQRPDLADQSPSGFDQSLADFAAIDDWTDQQIVDLLITHRRQHGDEMKLDRTDYYERTIAAARAAVTNRTNAVATGTGGVGQPPPPTGTQRDPGIIKELADAILQDDHFTRDASGKLHVFVDGVYVPGGAEHIEFQVKHLLEAWGQTRLWSSHRAGQVVKYIATDAPLLWERPPDNIINLKNGLLDVNTLALSPHSPDHLSTVQLGVAYDPAATCPAWDRFVASTFPKDAQDSPYEVVANTMLPAGNRDKSVLGTGPGSNGKGTFVRALTAFLGKNNICARSLQALEHDRFAVADLAGKLANIDADLSGSGLASSAVFKKITGGDLLTGEHKFEHAFTFRSFAHLLFAANSIPRVGDASEAFFTRWVVIPFPNVFEDTSDEATDALDASLSDPSELSGVLNKALAVLPRVRKSGFTIRPSMEEAWKEFRYAADPFAGWLDVHTGLFSTGLITKDDLADAYRDYCVKTKTPILLKTAIGEAMRRLRPEVVSKQRKVNGKLTWCWIGIKFRRSS